MGPENEHHFSRTHQWRNDRGKFVIHQTMILFVNDVIWLFVDHHIWRHNQYPYVQARLNPVAINLIQLIQKSCFDIMWCVKLLNTRLHVTWLVKKKYIKIICKTNSYQKGHFSTRGASSLPKKLSLLSMYSVAISFYSFLQNIRNTLANPSLSSSFTKSVLL